MNQKLKKPLQITIALLAALLIISFFAIFLHSSVRINESTSLNIYPNETVEQVLGKLKEKGNIKDIGRISFMLGKMGYKEPVHSGHYIIKPGMSDFRIARMLNGGYQTPVKLTFNNVRTVDELAGRLSHQLMTDSLTLLNCFRDSSWINKAGLNQYNYLCVFIPDTYEVWWDATPEKILSKLRHGYDNFWNENHLNTAKKIRLTPEEISTLASIVEEETNKSDEMPKVAGLYINRLRIGMPLQADPTVKFAVGDFSLKRILKGNTLVNSPYNTYKFAGLPPGPIRIPSIKALEAVLYYERHSYIYMCARSDFSGYHAFATTLKQHNDNAALYHKALNSKGIVQ